MISAIFIIAASLFLSYTNGANDNFKGVATLFGSGTTDYKRALYWATVTTFAGSLTAIAISHGMVSAFSGKGLVPDILVNAPSFLLAVSAGAALTVGLATITGFPVSTTHALVGGLIGAGFAAGESVQYHNLTGAFVLPLLLSPLLSMFLSVLIYPASKIFGKVCGISEQTCICIDGKDEIVHFSPGGAAVLKSTGLVLTMDQMSLCRSEYRGAIMGLSVHRMLSGMHFISAGAVSFARGLNDTPKITALLAVSQVLRMENSFLAVAVAMSLGGLLSARKVAHTMSRKITAMSHGQGFSANLVSAVLVLTASLFSLPVSTTHVTCGSLFGIGFVNGKADFSVIRNILLSWLVTLPLSALLAYTIFTAL